MSLREYQRAAAYTLRRRNYLVLCSALHYSPLKSRSNLLTICRNGSDLKTDKSFGHIIWSVRREIYWVQSNSRKTNSETNLKNDKNDNTQFVL